MPQPGSQSITARVRERQRSAALAGNSRVGVHSKRQLRDQQKRWLPTYWLGIALILALAGTTAAAIHLFAWTPIAPYLVGATLASGGWWIYTLMLEEGGIVSKRSGVAAESWTAGELRPLRRQGWKLVNHVMLTKSDVDHALLGPGGFIAVETKFRSDWAKAEVDLGEFAVQARRAEWQLQSRLQVNKPTVQSVVVMWGPRVSQHFPDVFELNGVTFCHGGLLRTFVRALPEQVAADDLRKAFASLDRYVKKRDSGEIVESGEMPRGLNDLWTDLLVVAASVMLTVWLVLAPASTSPVGFWSVAVAVLVATGAMLTRRRWPNAARVKRATTAAVATSAGLGCLVALATMVL